MERIHATCVSTGRHGVLLRGPSGCGKSDLALRIISSGGRLVADDYTELRVRGQRLIASPPDAIRGIIEVRGLGLLRMRWLQEVALAAIIDLVASEEVPRMPEPERADLLGIALPLYRLAPFEASAAAKVRLAVRLASGGIMAAR